MCRRYLQASGLVLNSSEMIAIGESVSAGGADNLVFQIAADVRELGLGIVGLLCFERPGLNRAIDLAQVIDAGVHLGRSAGFNEVGNRNSR